MVIWPGLKNFFVKSENSLKGGSLKRGSTVVIKKSDVQRMLFSSRLWIESVVGSEFDIVYDCNFINQ